MRALGCAGKTNKYRIHRPLRSEVLRPEGDLNECIKGTWHWKLPIPIEFLNVV